MLVCDEDKWQGKSFRCKILYVTPSREHEQTDQTDLQTVFIP